MNAISVPLLQAWSAVVANPLFLIGLTLGVYQLGQTLYDRTRMALLHPLIVAIGLLIPALWLLGLEYPTYRDAVFPLTMLLAPATVALGVPLYHNLRRIRQYFWPVMITLLVGGCLSAFDACWPGCWGRTSACDDPGAQIADHADCHGGGRAAGRHRGAGGGLCHVYRCAGRIDGALAVIGDRGDPAFGSRHGAGSVGPRGGYLPGAGRGR